MTLSRTVVIPGLLAELEAFGALIGPLDDADWARPTRCEGWAVSAVAFEGIEEVPVGAGGAKRTGDALEFVLVATGRADPSALGRGAPVNIYA